MQLLLRLANVVCLLLLVAACTRHTAEPQTKTLDKACVLVLAAHASGDQEITRLQEDLRAGRSGARAAEHLGYRFIARARVTSDPGYYTIAEQAAFCLDSLSAGDPAGLLLRGHVLHQTHRFADAEAIARRLIAGREFVLDYGLLGDALLEQGRMAEAAEAYQEMIDLKPFYQSYTRVAHLRWLKGDLDGAIQLMQSALKAASPRDRESVAWAYVRLAVYELQRGRLSEALRMTDGAFEYVPDYAAALLAKGRILLADGRTTEAVAWLQRAADRNPTPEYLWTLADSLRAAGHATDAEAIDARLLRDGVIDDPRTVALFLATRATTDDSAKAVGLARRELEKRADIFTLDALAWALASDGQLQEASSLMARALSEGTEDGRLFVHAAAIAAAEGRAADAARWAQRARALRFTLLPSEIEVLRSNIVHRFARGN